MTHLLLILILLAIIGPPIWRWREERRLRKAIRRQAKFTGTYDLRYTPGMTDYMMTRIIGVNFGYENGIILTRKQIRALKQVTPTCAETRAHEERELRRKKAESDVWGAEHTRLLLAIEGWDWERDGVPESVRAGADQAVTNWRIANGHPAGRPWSRTDHHQEVVWTPERAPAPATSGWGVLWASLGIIAFGVGVSVMGWLGHLT